MGDNVNVNMLYYNNNNNYTNANTNTNGNNGNCLSSSSDDISNLLHQIIVPSSSSLSSGMAHFGDPTEIPRRLSPSPAGGRVKQGMVLAVDSCGRGSGGSGLVGAAGENDTDHECESEEGLEALVDEAPQKRAPPRSSSKRSRAAEVHNLSEKRRRSRINEKMKALQNLIPNSNKTDKASMLDEAIEYLKQLQLQVQMLSMRNGLSLHPMCLPGVLQPIQFSQTRIGFGEESGSLPVNVSGTMPANQETSAQMVFDLPNQCSSSNHASINMSNIITSETSFGLESIQAQFGPFQLLTSSQDVCREDILPHHQLKTNASELGSGATGTVSLRFNTQTDPKDSSSVDASLMERDQPNSLLLKNMEHDLILSPHLTGRQTGRRDPSDEIKIEKPRF